MCGSVNQQYQAVAKFSARELLSDLGTINPVKLRLEPFKFVGIGLALATIVLVLRWQSNRLWEVVT